ncbi:MAG: MFS transporter [Gammaproteobacteria bacterium]|nr:MFS transporter [Gammaproteobacteria bacterium]
MPALTSVILDSRLWRIFLLGVSSGFPWLIIGSGMSAWLTDEGLSRSGVGLFGVIFVAYTINFLWAPVVDHLRLPVLGALGQRRSWTLLCQALLVLLILVLSLNDPSSDLWLTAAIALIVATVSATQDLSIDAYRITVIRADEPHLVGPAAAMTTCGWWTGASLPGVAAFWLADDLGWPLVYKGLALFMLAVALFTYLVIREPERPAASVRRAANLIAWLDSSYFDAVAEFFRRNGMKMALAVLGFIFLFKIGEAFLGRMAIVFYKEVGFTSEEIGTYSKLVGWWVTVVCSLLAGFISVRYGVIRVLFAAGVAMAAANLLFSWIAVVGPDTKLFALAVVVDGITAAVSTVAFVAFISEYTSRLHSATQYAALASLGNSSRTLLSATSGILVTQLDGDWALFFVITALMVVPSLLLLAWIACRFHARS